MADKTRENWERVDPELRKKCVDHLQTLPADIKADLGRVIKEHPDDWYTQDMTPPSEQARIQAKYGVYVPDIFHWGLGMGIRNYLRGVVRDDELPLVEYEDGSYQNWDDYYTAAIEDVFGGQNDRD